jgi:hypothetical protein
MEKERNIQRKVFFSQKVYLAYILCLFSLVGTFSLAQSFATGLLAQAFFPLKSLHNIMNFHDKFMT